MPDEVYSVSDITADIRESLEDRFNGVWVEGEISNHRLPASGHHYFTLKDSGAQLSCVLFRGAAMKSRIPLSDGMQVQAYGNISVYEARGQYQLIAQVVQPQGFGDLQVKFEALKRKLEAEGLFDPIRKKRIPSFPQRIGIVTSPTGAAIKDMINVLSRRAPWVEVMIQPVRVQGEGAAEEIAAGVRAFEMGAGIPRPDLIIVARGGGSIEDLWSFNEEVVARAIAEATVPVMSGVGHEIDFTITDFVADRREPTPSAAAENAVPDGESLMRHINLLQASLNGRVEGRIDNLSRQAIALQRELQAREPGRRIQSWAQSLDYLAERLESAADLRLQVEGSRLEAQGRLLETIQPEKEIDRCAERLSLSLKQLDTLLDRRLEEAGSELEHFHELVRSLSPDAVLSRGFSMTLDEEGKLVTEAASVSKGDHLKTRFPDGDVSSVVE